MSLPQPSGPVTQGPPTQIPAFDNTLGALLIGGLVAMALWGMTCVQTFTFFTRISRDPISFRLLVAFLWLLDTFDSALNAHILYHYLVSNYLNPQAIEHPIWSVIIHVAITSISNFLIRTMFARRFYRLSRGNLLVTAWIMAISATDLVCGIVITGKAFGIATYLQLQKINNLFYLNFASGTASDLSVAIALSWLLVRSRTGFRRTDTLINTLMVYIVNTGLIVGIDAILGLVFYVAMPTNFIFLGFYLLLSKLYLNSYLASLNARDDLRSKVDDPVSFHLSQLPRSHGSSGQETSATLEPPFSPTTKGSRNHMMAISVNTDTFIEKGDQLPSPGITKAY